jgi:hypothetical protein
MADLPEDMLYEGVSLDISFSEPRPSFGDLYLIRGSHHPHFPPTGSFGFEDLAAFQFDQVDDYYGVRSLSRDGADVVIWLYPLVEGMPAYHHPGPFDGVRLDYSVLRNPARHADYFLRCVEGFAPLGNSVTYRSRGLALGVPPDLSSVREDIQAVVRHWAAAGIVVGSDDAMGINF